MSIDPIRFFSRCQTSFIQKSDLETKIYTVTCSVLAGTASYFLNPFKAGPLRNVESSRIAIGVSVLSWLFLSTSLGYLFRRRENKT